MALLCTNEKISNSVACHIDGKIEFSYPSYQTAIIPWNEVAHYSDNLIPKEHQQALIKETQLLITDKTKLNYRNIDLTNKESLHNIQIQDLIEPSHHNELYHHTLSASAPSTPIDIDCIEDINKWIPTIFELNHDTKQYEIKSDINGLSKQRYPKLYEIIGNIFTKMIPNMHRALSTQYRMESTLEFEPEFAPEFAPIYKKDLVDLSDLSTVMKKEIKEYLNDKYYAIVKITDYQFMDPNKSSYGGGNYHKEGFENEFIKSGGLYYFDVSNNVDAGKLFFREKGFYENSVEIKNGRCIFFTNDEDHTHQAGAMNIILSAPQQDSKPLYQDKNGKNVFGTRKLLGFCLLDPNKYSDIKTSKEILVNMEDKIPLIIGYWIRNIIDKQMNDLINIIVMFSCGDMEYIKTKTDENRRRRYEAKEEMDSAAGD